MKILYTSDIHASNSHLVSMLSVANKESVDCIIVGGDIIPHHLPGEQRSGILDAQAAYLEDTFIPSLKSFKQKRDISLYLDMSNDDFACNRTVLEEYKGDLFYLLHMEKHPLTDSVDIIGYMNVPPTPFGRKDWEKPDSRAWPYAPGGYVTLNGVISDNGTIKEKVIHLDSEDTIENDLKKLSENINKPFVFVSHTPPYNTPLDVIADGTHVGSMSVRNFIEKWSVHNRIKASLHGHIHESPKRSGSISTKIANVLCVNPGQGNGDSSKFRYVIFDFDMSGTNRMQILNRN
ncbi:MAG: metallophosphoesterase [Deltaproteobacteria bacterium]|nr:metallophosphoesterase [Deltaproteobacteria bacterium]MBW2218939.1 metallophosphoesterase [Deltaproteobacteria bacterium]